MPDVQKEMPFYIWKDPEGKYLNDVIQFVKKENHELNILYFPGDFTLDDGFPFLKHFLDLSNQFGFFSCEHSTLLNYKDHLLALELCISRLKVKQTDKDFVVDKAEVKECHLEYVNHCLSESIPEKWASVLNSYEEFLTHSNCLTIWKLYKIIKENIDNEKLQNHFATHQYLLLGLPKWNILVQFMKILVGKKEMRKVLVETSLNSSIEDNSICNTEKNVDVSDEILFFDDLIIDLKSISQGSATEEYTSDVILAFLSLIVNSRNELALSKAMVSPIINLSHTAFTDLKHLSLEKEMSMCQTVISYVTKVRLGGKGYAPPADCPLLIYLKSLEQFVDLLNQLHTIIEEDMSGNAVKRVINILKKKLLKSGKLKSDSIENIAKDLIEKSIFLGKLKSVQSESNQIGQESFNVLHDLVNFMAYTTSLDQNEITNSSSTKRTPLNLPPLMGYFRTPEDETSNDDSQISVKSTKSIQLETKNEIAPVISYFHHSESNSVSKSCIDENTPTKTSFQGCLSITKEVSIENKRQPLTLISNNGKPSIKRALVNDKPKVTNKKIKKLPKGKVQIKGQGQITSFFIRN